MSKVEKFLRNQYDQLNLRLLEQTLAYTFSDKLLLLNALSHPSLKQGYSFKMYFLTQQYDFEKLEFLGDSVLSLVIIDLLNTQYLSSSQGMLAKFKNHLVAKKTLASVAETIELGNFLILSNGELEGGGKNNVNNLENAMEAVIGAIYLDGGLKSATKVIKKLWQKAIKDVSSKALDPKSSLQEMSQAIGEGLPQYEIVSQSGTNNAPIFEIKVSVGSGLCSLGKGKSKKEAEIDAAKALLALITN
jgi:ribonuclease III